MYHAVKRGDGTGDYWSRQLLSSAPQILLVNLQPVDGFGTSPARQHGTSPANLRYITRTNTK